MPTTITQTVYTFDELSPKAKERARDWWRQLEHQDFEACFEAAETAAKLMGISFGTRPYSSAPSIYWSGFCSQGDGASFVGEYEYNLNCARKIRQEFPTDETLHKIVDALVALQKPHSFKLTASIERSSSNYCHEYTMQVAVYVPEEDPPFEAEIVQTTIVEIDGLPDDVEVTLLEIMRNFARWIYRGIEAEYDYQMSDECVDDTLEANEYTFTEDGERA